MNDKGLSGVVETVLIMMITIGAIAILASFIIPFVKDNLSKSGECIGMEQAYKFESAFDLNCLRSVGINERIDFSVKAGGNLENENVAGFNLIVYSEEDSEIIEARKTGSSPGLEMYGGGELKIPSSGESKSYSYSLDSGKSYRYAEIKTVLENGRICDAVNDKINLGNC